MLDLKIMIGHERRLEPVEPRASASAPANGQALTYVRYEDEPGRDWRPALVNEASH
jgi:hypothetical protein